MKKVIPTDAVLIPDIAERKFQGIVYDVYQWEQKLFDGSSTTFEMLKRADTVVAICIVDDKILVIDDDQPHSGAKVAFPGGRTDKTDATVLSAVQREVSEETGYTFIDWRLLNVYQPHTKQEWFVYIFLATGEYTSAPVHIDAGEKITVKQLPFEEVKQLSLNKAGYLKDAEDIFSKIHNLDELKALPEFKGQEVDR